MSGENKLVDQNIWLAWWSLITRPQSIRTEIILLRGIDEVQAQPPFALLVVQEKAGSAALVGRLHSVAAVARPNGSGCGMYER